MRWRRGVTVKLAKRLVEPTWLSHPVYVETYGPEVCELNALADFAPDPEQELILNLLFAIGADGKSVVFEADVIGPRQNFKTGLIKQAEIGWLFVTEQRLIVHSAHELDTTAEAFRDLAGMIEDTPALSKRLLAGRGDRPGITEGNGKWKIELVGDRRIRYKARTLSGGRGLTGDKIVLDEGQELLPSHMGSLLPTLVAVPDPQVLTAGSGGMLKSAVLRDKRDRGRVGATPNQLYVEYGDKRPWQGCADKDCTHHKRAVGCAADDEERWATIMPALGRRVMPATVRSLRQAMPVEEFLREMLVWWEDPPLAEDDQIFGTHWGARAIEDAKQPAVDCIGLAASVDLANGSIGATGKHGDALRLINAVERGPGVEWLKARALDISAKTGCLVAVDGGGPLADFVSDPDDEWVKALGSRLVVAKLSDMKDACAALFTSVTDAGDVGHLDHPDLNAAVMCAVKREVGDRFVWGRRKSAGDVSMLEAVTLALWGASKAQTYDVLDSFY